MKKVFLISKLRGDVEDNIELARDLCRRITRMGHAPFAPHIFYTQFLSDDLISERESGMACGHAFLKVCDEAWVYVGRWGTDEISSGMTDDIRAAKEAGIPVFAWDLVNGTRPY